MNWEEGWSLTLNTASGTPITISNGSDAGDKMIEHYKLEVEVINRLGKDPKNMIHASVIATLASIKIWERRIEALQYAAQGGTGYSNAPESKDLRGFLFERLHDCYRNFFMIAHFVDDKKIQKLAQELAREKFLSEGMGIMHLLQLDGDYPGSSPVDEENEFRWDIAEVAMRNGVPEAIVKVDCPECNSQRGQACRTPRYKKREPHKGRLVKSIKVSTGRAKADDD